jgi:predicted esterase
MAAVSCLLAGASAPAQGTGGGDPTYEARLFEQLRQKLTSGGEAYGAGEYARAARDYEEAALAGRQLASIGSRRVDVVQAVAHPLYNGACSAALAGDAANGYRLLAAAIEAGWDDLELLEGDGDLDLLRDDAEAFDRIVGVLRRQQERWMEGFAAGRIFVPRELRQGTGWAGGTRGDDGAMVDDATEPVGAIVFLHGSGGNVEEAAPFAEAMMRRAGVPVIVIRGPIAFGRGQFRWRQAQAGAECALIDEWVARARADVPRLDPALVVIAGFSQGGGQALLLGLDGPREFAGAIAMGPYVQVAQRHRLAAESFRGGRIAVVVGENEEVAILDAAATVEKLNGFSGLEVRRTTVPGMGHALPNYLVEDVARHYAWIQEGLAGRKSEAAETTEPRRAGGEAARE